MGINSSIHRSSALSINSNLSNSVNFILPGTSAGSTEVDIDEQNILLEYKHYIDEQNISSLITNCFIQLCLNRPSDPYKFLRQYFTKLESDCFEKNSQKKFEINTKNDENSNQNLIPPADMCEKRAKFFTESIPEDLVMDYQKKVILKDFKSMNIILKTLKKRTTFSHLDDEELADIVDSMYSVSYGKGDNILNKGDSCDGIYIVAKGEIMVHNGPNVLKTLSEGSAHNEKALISPTLSEETLTAKTDVRVWTLTCYTFKLILMSTRLKRTFHYKEFLKHLHIFRYLDNNCLTEMAEMLEIKIYEDGDTIIDMSRPSDDFYIIERGNAVMFKKETGHFKPTECCCLRPMDMFGDVSLFINDAPKATIVAKGPIKCLKFNRKIFERMTGFRRSFR